MDQWWIRATLKHGTWFHNAFFAAARHTTHSALLRLPCNSCLLLADPSIEREVVIKNYSLVFQYPDTHQCYKVSLDVNNKAWWISPPQILHFITFPKTRDGITKFFISCCDSRRILGKTLRRCIYRLSLFLNCSTIQVEGAVNSWSGRCNCTVVHY